MLVATSSKHCENQTKHYLWARHGSYTDIAALVLKIKAKNLDHKVAIKKKISQEN